jgi:hypothetical protein
VKHDRFSRFPVTWGYCPHAAKRPLAGCASPDNYGGNKGGEQPSKQNTCARRQELQDAAATKASQFSLETGQRKEELLLAINKQAEGKALSADLHVALNKRHKKTAPLTSTNLSIAANNKVDTALIQPAQQRTERITAPSRGKKEENQSLTDVGYSKNCSSLTPVSRGPCPKTVLSSHICCLRMTQRTTMTLFTTAHNSILCCGEESHHCLLITSLNTSTSLFQALIRATNSTSWSDNVSRILTAPPPRLQRAQFWFARPARP